MKTQSAIAIMLLLSAGTAIAAQPEIKRATGTPQANGRAHTIRTIPEACARLEGVFTGNAKNPYSLKPVKTNPSCQPRAKLVDAATVNAKEGKSWTLNDVIRVPSQSCAGQVAVITVYRLNTGNAAYKLDAQGRARVYLQDEAQKKYTAGDPKRTTPAYAVSRSVEGKPCG